MEIESKPWVSARQLLPPSLPLTSFAAISISHTGKQNPRGKAAYPNCVFLQQSYQDNVLWREITTLAAEMNGWGGFTHLFKCLNAKDHSPNNIVYVGAVLIAGRLEIVYPKSQQGSMYVMALTWTEPLLQWNAALSPSDRQLLNRETLSPCMNGSGWLKVWVPGVLRATWSQQTGKKPIWTLCWCARKGFEIPKVN